MDVTQRLLRMLALLPARPVWTAEELAERLEVTTRTVRRDVAKLRELGYAVDAEPGRYGGYRLARGQVLPPLVLTDEEAVAVAVGLRGATVSGVGRLDDSAVTALAKLEQVLPSRLRERVAAIGADTIHLGGSSHAVVDATVLADLALACRRDERVLLGYRDREGTRTRRDVDPHEVVHAAGRWYLVARDVRKGEWRTFRIDRVTDVLPTAVRTGLVDPPDAAALVAEALTFGPYRWRATVRLVLPLEEARYRVSPAFTHLEADGDTTLLSLGADSLDWLARFIVSIGCDVEVVEPLELGDELRRLGERLRETADAAGGAPRSP
jgi:predicted DNA-binding transcriptional regulator YafY